MPRLQRFLRILAVVSVTVFAASFIVESYFEGKAQLVQRVEYDPASSSLLGEVGPMVGSPQKMIIEDPRAFVKGNGPDGSMLVDDLYLKAHHIYPLQLQSISYLSNLIRLILFFVGALATLVFATLSIRAKRLKVSAAV